MKRKDGVLGVEIVGGLREVGTPWAGASLLAELFRRSGVDKVANKALPAKGSAKGLKQGQPVESFVLLSALGGENVDDMQRLRDDDGLARMLGYRPPAPETARHWLDKFHDDSTGIEQPLQGSFIPTESGPLSGLNEVKRRTIWAYVEAGHPGWDVTLDVDAQLIETAKAKADARYCYEGYKAFQPMEVCWAETMLVLGDEFREGNVPAYRDVARVVDEAYEMLPPGEWRVKVRSDAAGYQQGYLDHWDRRGWGFGVSADMSPQLRREIEGLPEDCWQQWKEEGGGVIREWAEVAYVPARKNEKRGSHPYRYLAIRVKRQQGQLFDDGGVVRHYAVVSNIWEVEGRALLEWQRGKAGTIEHIHHILDNELAAGVFPSAKHGANAAWLRLQVVTHNLQQMLKKLALPAEYAHAHPKRLRFCVFTAMGRLVSHAGRMLLRIPDGVLETLIAPSRRRMREMVWDTS